MAEPFRLLSSLHPATVTPGPGMHEVAPADLTAVPHHEFNGHGTGNFVFPPPVSTNEGPSTAFRVAPEPIASASFPQVCLNPAITQAALENPVEGNTPESSTQPSTTLTPAGQEPSPETSDSSSTELHTCNATSTLPQQAVHLP
ncbi:hypothetical protein B0T16DRAFT_392801 [Cercophora newfieldiana]|uniref:Uncharacterized protein n=1 Tax=Cercophora newfieldiana TaxID=92897 RepID=A0AA40CMY1_9PEZI|nr:hypothetical protein B0T16DRAFT_392801 [Cercophora newfieldiana]